MLSVTSRQLGHATSVRAGSVRHREPLVVGGHERSRPVSKNPRSRIIHRYHLGRGAPVPWGKVVTNGVPVVAARRLPSMLRALPAVLGPERVTALADQARIRFRAAA